ncbi:phage tail assembly chaperone [Paraburkholderia bryophila]|uniref:Phage tail assembly chaperone-like domain-containing protein n=1 Tax=Paraburkholderia bryophila TaxID=420952 RepID=A0A7Y9WJF3_9BURK|nr:phage tail assembly chaperone [Paraburkholderia bryophila]NYH21375.1 hypothetical protein [Paraburkholderia bryophila]
MKFSPSMGSGYPEDVEYAELPADLIEVSDADWQSAMARPAGYTFTFSKDGVLSIYPPAEPTADDKAASARAQRDLIMSQCEWVVNRHRDQQDAGSGTSLSTAQYQTWLSYRQSLRDISKQPTWPTSVDWPTAPPAAAEPQE